MKFKAVRLAKYDNNILRALLSLRVDEIEAGELQNDEVLIKMEAAPCNPSDIAFLRGGYNIVKPLPAVPGFEGTGMVTEAGNEAKGMLGKMVSCFIQEEGDGSWSEYFRTRARNCIVMKPEMETGQAACFSINPLTAYGLFEMVKQKQAKAFIQNAAGGQVPGFLRVFARKHGIPVINLVRKSDHAALLQEQGAENVLDTTAENFTEVFQQLCSELKPSIAFDAVAGESAGSLLNALPNGGEVVVYGGLSGSAIAGIDPMGIIFRQKSIRGFNLNDFIAGLDRSEFNVITDDLQDKFIAGELKTEIQAVFSLDRVIDGVKTYIRNMSAGKVLFTP